MSKTILKNNNPLPLEKPEITLNDEELQMSKNKFLNAYKMFEKSSKENLQISDKSKEKIFQNLLNQERNLFHNDPVIQEKCRKTFLESLDKKSHNPDLELKPLKVYEALKRKIGIGSYDSFLATKITSHYKKKISILKSQQAKLFHDYAKCNLFEYGSENFQAKKENFEAYNQILGNDFKKYSEIYFRIMNNNDAADRKSEKIPKITLNPNIKLTFSNIEQRGPIKMINADDYKLYLANKLKSIKFGRKLKKFKELIHYLPYQLQNEFFKVKSEIKLNNDKYIESIGLITQKEKYKIIMDLEILKDKIVKLAKKYSIDDDINIDNGAYLLFKIDCMFKTKFQDQNKFIQSAMNENHIKSQTSRYLTFEQNGNPSDKKIIRVPDWEDLLPKFEEMNFYKKQEQVVYGESFDSLLIAWYKFLCLQDYEDVNQKIKFKTQRIKEFYEENNFEVPATFFEFFKGYLKLITINSRENIIRIYGFENYYQSLKRLLANRHKEIIKPSEQYNTFERLSVKLTDSQVLKKDKDRLVKGLFIDDNREIDESRRQVEIKDHEGRNIIYNSIFQAFEKRSDHLIKLAANFIDYYTAQDKKATQIKPLEDENSDDFDRETLFHDILEYESEYEFSKISILKNMDTLLRNSYLKENELAIMKYTLELISRSPRFSLFEESIQISYLYETKFAKKLAELIESLISCQKGIESDIFIGKTEDNTPMPNDSLSNSKDFSIVLNKIPATNPVQDLNGSYFTGANFGSIKFFEKLTQIFQILNIFDEAIKTSTKMFITEYNLTYLFEIENKLITETMSLWQKIKYNLNLTGIGQELDQLETDILLDIPHSYDFIKSFGATMDNLRLNKSIDMSKSKDSSKESSRFIEPGKDINQLADPNQDANIMKFLDANNRSFFKDSKQDPAKNNTKAKSFINEEEYTKNYLIFLRFKEIYLISLHTCAYLSQIYVDQATLFNKEYLLKPKETIRNINLNLHNDPKKKTFDYLFDRETLNAKFNLKDLNDAQLFILKPIRLMELPEVVEYFLLHQIIFTHTIYYNTIYLNELNSISQSYTEFTARIKNEIHASKFINILEKKKTWSSNSKTHAMPKLQKQDGNIITDSKSAKMEWFQEINNYVRKHIFLDALRLQTIEMVNEVKYLIGVCDLKKPELYEFSTQTLMNIEKNKSMTISDFQTISMDSSSTMKHLKAEETFYSKFFDEFGQVDNLFCLPTFIDLINIDADFDDESGETIREVGEHEEIEEDEHHKVKMSIKTIVPNSNKGQIFKPKGDLVTVQKISELKYITNSKLFTVLQTFFYMRNIIQFKMFEVILETNLEDLLPLIHNYYIVNDKLKRNEIRIKQCFDNMGTDLKKIKPNIDYLRRRSADRKSNPDIFRYLNELQKREWQSIHLVMFDALYMSRKQENYANSKDLKQFLQKMIYSKSNEVYKDKDELVYGSIFQDQPKVKDHSQLMELIFCMFISPQYKPDKKPSLVESLGKFDNSLNDLLIYQLINMKKPSRCYLSSSITQLKINLQTYANGKKLLPAIDIIDYEKTLNTILKMNIKNYSKKEAIVMIKEKNLPFCDIDIKIIDELETKVDYLINQAIGIQQKSEGNQSKLFNNSKELRLDDASLLKSASVQNKETLNKTPEQQLSHMSSKPEVIQESTNISESQKNPIAQEYRGILFNDLIVKCVTNGLRLELEKMLIEEGLAYYLDKIGDYSNRLHELNKLDGSSYPNPKMQINQDTDQEEKMIPCVHAFLVKVINESLIIDTLNRGESLVIATEDFQEAVSIMNRTLLEFFEHEKNEAIKSSKDRAIILETEAKNLRKEAALAKEEITLFKENNQNIIQAKVSEACSNLIFEIDMLKKKLKHEQEECDFKLRELREQVKKEYSQKILDDDLLYQKVLKRFFEYKEGMSLELRKFIDTEKHNTLKRIKDKKNEIFSTQVEVGAFGNNNRVENLGINGSNVVYDIDEPIDEALIHRIYMLIKKLRIFYYLKEVCWKEKGQRKMDEMKDTIAANQNLLNRIMELQTNEENLKQIITQARKEMAVMDQQNNILRKHLQNDQREKIKLMKINNQSRYEMCDLQEKYDDVVKKKAILIPTGNISASITRPLTAGSMKSHIDSLIKSSTVDKLESLPEKELYPDKEALNVPITNTIKGFESLSPIISRNTTRRKPSTFTNSSAVSFRSPQRPESDLNHISKSVLMQKSMSKALMSDNPKLLTNDPKKQISLKKKFGPRSFVLKKK